MDVKGPRMRFEAVKSVRQLRYRTPTRYHVHGGWLRSSAAAVQINMGGNPYERPILWGDFDLSARVIWEDA
jgi:hypothetical protein